MAAAVTSAMSRTMALATVTVFITTVTMTIAAVRMLTIVKAQMLALQAARTIPEEGGC